MASPSAFRIANGVRGPMRSVGRSNAATHETGAPTDIGLGPSAEAELATRACSIASRPDTLGSGPVTTHTHAISNRGGGAEEEEERAEERHTRPGSPGTLASAIQVGTVPGMRDSQGDNRTQPPPGQRSSAAILLSSFLIEFAIRIRARACGALSSCPEAPHHTKHLPSPAILSVGVVVAAAIVVVVVVVVFPGPHRRVCVLW